jgi:hypothetical protein
LSWYGSDQTSEQIARQINQSTPLPLRLETGQQASVAIEVVRATVPIVPTLYPEEPGGAVIVHNHITVNINGADFAEFSAKIDELLVCIGGSNEMSPEVRAKTAGERPATGAATTLSEARSLRMPTPAEWRVPIQRASKGRLFDQQYQDRFDKDYGAALRIGSNQLSARSTCFSARKLAAPRTGSAFSSS